MAHTPGPWEQNGNAVHKRVSKSYATCVCVCDGDDRIDNARLIASTPELLAACRNALLELSRLQPILCDEDADLVQETIEEIAEAMNKARGE
jgi:hypothetical protein